MTEAEKRETRRSAVRVVVTYIAAGFLFIVGTLLVGAFLWKGSHQEAKDVFLTILPISAAVVTYWFANRTNSKRTPNATDGE